MDVNISFWYVLTHFPSYFKGEFGLMLLLSLLMPLMILVPLMDRKIGGWKLKTAILSGSYLIMLIIVLVMATLTNMYKVDAPFNKDFIQKTIIPHIDSLPEKKSGLLSYERIDSGFLPRYEIDETYLMLSEKDKDRYLYVFSVIGKNVVEKELKVRVIVEKISDGKPYLTYKDVPELNKKLDFKSGWYDVTLHVPEGINYKKWDASAK